MQVILISGKAMSGKDSAAKIMKKHLVEKGYNVLICHYGDLVKFVAEKYFDWDGQKDEVGRTLLQYIGTDIVRAKMPNFWTDFVWDVLTMFQVWDFVLIPDARFPNEMQKTKGMKTTSVRIERIDFNSPLTATQQEHPSETALDEYPFDYYIHSESGLHYLEEEVVKFLNWYLDKIK